MYLCVYIYVLTYQNLETSWRYSGYISTFKCRDAGSVPTQGAKIAQATPGEAKKLNKWRRKDTFIKKMQSDM